MSIQDAYEAALRHEPGTPGYEEALQAVMLARLELEEREEFECRADTRSNVRN